MDKSNSDFINQLKKQRTKDEKSGLVSFYRENLPISKELVAKLISASIFDAKVSYFEIELGNRELTIWLNNNDLVLTIKEWNVLRSDESISSYIEYDQALLKSMLPGLVFDWFDVSNCIVYFKNGIKIKIEQTINDSEPWFFIDNIKSYVISALDKNNFTHIITCPDNLRDKYLYKERGSTVATLLYSLDFYRELVK